MALEIFQLGLAGNFILNTLSPRVVSRFGKKLKSIEILIKVNANSRLNDNLNINYFRLIFVAW